MVLFNYRISMKLKIHLGIITFFFLKYLTKISYKAEPWGRPESGKGLNMSVRIRDGMIIHLLGAYRSDRTWMNCIIW